MPVLCEQQLANQRDRGERERKRWWRGKDKRIHENDETFCESFRPQGFVCVCVCTLLCTNTARQNLALQRNTGQGTNVTNDKRQARAGKIELEKKKGPRTTHNEKNQRIMERGSSSEVVAMRGGSNVVMWRPYIILRESRGLKTYLRGLKT